MTPFNPDALAREWAAKDYADFTDVPGCTPILDTIVNERAQHYLSFARALIEQSGAVEALERASAPFSDIDDATVRLSLDALHPFHDLRPKAEMLNAVRSALANLRAVEGKP